MGLGGFVRQQCLNNKDREDIVKYDSSTVENEYYLLNVGVERENGIMSKVVGQYQKRKKTLNPLEIFCNMVAYIITLVARQPLTS